MSLLPNPDNLWLFVAFIAGLLVLACLRTIGCAYYNAVLWHNLKVDVRNLQIEQKRRLKELERAGQAREPRRSRRRTPPTESLQAPAPVGEEVAAPAAADPAEPADAIEVAPAEETPADAGTEPARAAA
jgi:hypothetical protein